METVELRQIRSTAETHIKNRQFASAAANYQVLVSSGKACPDDWFNFGVCLRQTGHPAEALKAFGIAIELGVSGAEDAHLNRSAILMNEFRDVRAAEMELSKALSIAPSNISARLNLATIREDVGDRGAASKLYREVLESEPMNSLALSRLAGLSTRRDPEDELVSRLRSALQRPDLTALSEAELGFALAGLLDRCGEFEEAFAVLKRANAANARTWQGAPFSESGLYLQLEATLRAFQSTEFELSDPVSEIAPIFIVGPYRSGSTLLEQILSGHSEIASGGEIEFWPRIARQAGNDPDRLAGIEPATLKGIREAYLTHLTSLSGGKPRICDKQPLNLWLCGLIGKALPQARFIHTSRHPLDTIVSLLFQHLHPSHSYAMSPEHAAHYLVAERRLIAHWANILPGRVHVLSYEALTSDPEKEIKALSDFLGVPYEASCLDFEKRGSVVRTASVWQVREALHRGSVGRWRHYERYLEGARAILMREGILSDH